MPDTTEIHARVQRLDDLLREAEEQADPAMKARLQEIASSLLELHGIALERILTLLADAGDAGDAVLAQCAKDPLVSPIFVLHGLHPQTLAERVAAALERVRPQLKAHGGQVELLAVTDDGAVSLRLEGNCHSCPSSRVTLQSLIEEEIYAAAPEVIAIHVEGVVEEPPAAEAAFVPLTSLAINGSALHATP